MCKALIRETVVVRNMVSLLNSKMNVLLPGPSRAALWDNFSLTRRKI